MMDIATQLNKQAMSISMIDDSLDEQIDKENVSVIDFKMITFSLAGKDYAIDIMKVKEIAKAGRFTYVPNALPFVVGVYNLRGDIIPIIDFRVFFNINVAPRADDALENMLIITAGEQTFGAIVDEIHSVVGVQKSGIQPPHPLFGDISIRYISGVVEKDKHLYILLDIDRIFNGKIDATSAKKVKPVVVHSNPSMPTMAQKVPSSSEKTDAKAFNQKDYDFIVDDLMKLEEFYVSNLNEKWTKSRFELWEKEHEGKSTQLLSKEIADEYLSTFWSRRNGKWWTKDFADAVYKLLPDNTAKQIVVWNIGCGKGYESYSLCCLLKKRYPDSKIRIYAQDKDLLGVSNAPLMTIEPTFANDWYAPYVTRKANGEFTFTQEVKDSILFEYHDCSNTNAVAFVDIVFARDVISLMPTETQAMILADVTEKMKGNGILVLGDNETLSGYVGWKLKGDGSFSVYTK